MVRVAGADPIYAAADQFRERCLVNGTSLLWPEVNAWSVANIEALLGAFMGEPDYGKGSFVDKWRKQLADQSPDVHRVAVDVLAFYYLFPGRISQATKLRNVTEVSGWKLARGPELDLLRQAYGMGLGHPGAFYNTGQPVHLAFYLEFAKRIHSEGIDPHDPDECKRLADEVKEVVHGSSGSRHILLHLLFPDRFEQVVSDGHKEKIVTAFKQFSGGVSDIDEALSNIRSSLSQRFGANFDFYDDDVKGEWQGGPPPTKGAGLWIFQGNPKFYDVRAAVRALREETWLVTGYRNAIKPGDRVYLWESGAEGGVIAVGEVLDSPSVRPIPEVDKPFVRDPSKFAGDKVRVKVRIDHVLDPVLTRIQVAKDPALRNLAILRFANATNFPVTPDEAEVLDDLIKGEDPLGVLAETLLISREYLDRIRELLEAKGQVVFYGPPGTGKTYVARALARLYAGTQGRMETVQFHPSYAYEDFIEGYRPKLIGGMPGFELEEGPLKRIGRQAAEAPQAQHVLVIDELNRGNVAKVFGELYFLLEYRGERMSLQYSKEQFGLPPNLWIIGTMNTADRSIALVDAALRRRFFFVPFFPDRDPVEGLLRRWLERNHPALTWLAAVVDKANAMMGDRQAAIGPSHFMRAGLDEKWINVIWSHSVLPYLAEHFFGDEGRIEEFELPRLRRMVEASGQ